MIDVDRPRDRILRLRLNRPERRNALDGAMVTRLIEVFAGDGRGVAAVVLSGRDGFCSGLDVSLHDRERAEVSDRLYELYRLMVGYPRPVVAAARGHAIGAGAQLLIASDLRVVSADCDIRFPGPEHGLAVGAWGLPSLVGRGRAMDLCLTMRPVGSAEALRIGLVDRVADDPDAAALAIASDLADLDVAAVERVKSVVARACVLGPALTAEAGGNRGHVPSAGRRATADREGDPAWRARE